MALSALAVLLAAGLALLLLQSGDNIVTAGGARISAARALTETEMVAFPGAQALDGDDTTYWGIDPAPDGSGTGLTTYVIEFAEEQAIVRVGISNGTSTELGRVDAVLWATSIGDLSPGGSSLEQALEDAPGEQTTAFRVTTTTLILALHGVHGDAVNAGIAEILIEVEE